MKVRKPITVIILIMVLVFVSLIFVFNNEQRVTEIEVKEAAFTSAYNYDGNAELWSVTALGDISGDGRAKSWRFNFISNPIENQNDSKKQGMRFKVIANHDGSTSIEESPTTFIVFTMSNWSIDSNRAVEIACSNSEVNSWLASHSGHFIERLTLSAGELNSTWNIEWTDSGIADNPYHLDVQVNAQSGEIISIEEID